MTFLDRSQWAGKIYLGGWTPGSNGEYPVVEPATGQRLTRIGAASPADVRKAAETAVQAQRDWCRLPYNERAAVLRRAGELFVEHEDEIHEWLIRESGATRPFAHFQTSGVAAADRAGVRRGDLRPGRAGGALPRRRGGGPAGRRHRVRLYLRRQVAEPETATGTASAVTTLAGKVG